MEEKKEQTKQLITAGLKEIMLSAPFEKITIRMIAEKAGIIRPTFYYHFQDKYEVLEWIVSSELITPANELIAQGRYMDGIKSVFSNVGADRQFYKKAFEIGGQNAFSLIMANEICKYISAFSEENINVADKLPPFVSMDMLMRQCAMNFTNIIYMWVTMMPNTTVEEITRYFEYTVSNPWSGILGFDK